MNRRGFIQCVAALVGASAIPVGAQSALIEQVIASKSAWPAGMLREVWNYVIDRDTIMVRYDILFGPGKEKRLSASGDEQIHIDFEFEGKESFESFKKERRAIVRVMFENELTKRGKAFASLRPLYIPSGMHAKLL